jgi:hypothetical protein
MNNLAQLQRDLQAHVLDGDDAIAEAIDSNDDMPAATRLNIYSDAYRLRLIEALEANYPVLAKLLDDEAFGRMTQEYLAINPSRHFSIRWFGHRLPGFLREFADYRDQPWLAELAEWEWKIAAAFDAADAPPLSIDDVAGIAPEHWAALRLTLHPSVRRVSLKTNIVQIAKAAAEGAELPAPTPLDTGVEWLIWRQDLSVQYRSLSTAEAAAVDAISSGATFGEMCEAVAQFVGDDDAPLQAATFLKQWLGDYLIVANN